MCALSWLKKIISWIVVVCFTSTSVLVYGPSNSYAVVQKTIKEDDKAYIETLARQIDEVEDGKELPSVHLHRELVKPYTSLDTRHASLDEVAKIQYAISQAKKILEITGKPILGASLGELPPLESITWESDDEHILGHFKALRAILQWPEPRPFIKEGEVVDIFRHIEKEPMTAENIKKLGKGMTFREYFSVVAEEGVRFDYARLNARKFVEKFGIWERGTFWFRYKEQIENIIDYVKTLPSDKPVRILIHATWNGEDAYSLAVALKHLFPERKFEIQGLDFIEPNPDEISWVYKVNIPVFLRGSIEKYFVRKTPEVVALKEEYLDLVKTEQGDVRNPESFGKDLDIVIINGVLTQTIRDESALFAVLNNAWEALKPGGRLYINNKSFTNALSPSSKRLSGGIEVDFVNQGKFKEITETYIDINYVYEKTGLEVDALDVTGKSLGDINEIERNIEVKNQYGIHGISQTVIWELTKYINDKFGVKFFFKKDVDLIRTRPEDVMMLEILNGDKVTVFAAGTASNEILNRIMDVMERLLQDEETLEGKSGERPDQYIQDIDQIEKDENLLKVKEIKKELGDLNQQLLKLNSKRMELLIAESGAKDEKGKKKIEEERQKVTREIEKVRGQMYELRALESQLGGDTVRGLSLGRKERIKFDLELTTNHIIELFRTDKSRKILPSTTELSSDLGPTRMTFLNYYLRILGALNHRINEEGFDSQIKKRLSEAIRIKEKEMTARKEAVSFDLGKTVDHITHLFESDKRLETIPSLRRLSHDLGPSRTTFSNHYSEILSALRVKVNRKGFNPDLKGRILGAIEAKEGVLIVGVDINKDTKNLLNLYETGNFNEFIRLLRNLGYNQRTAEQLWRKLNKAAYHTLRQRVVASKDDETEAGSHVSADIHKSKGLVYKFFHDNPLGNNARDYFLRAMPRVGGIYVPTVYLPGGRTPHIQELTVKSLKDEIKDNVLKKKIPKSKKKKLIADLVKASIVKTVQDLWRVGIDSWDAFFPMNYGKVKNSEEYKLFDLGPNVYDEEIFAKREEFFILFAKRDYEKNFPLIMDVYRNHVFSELTWENRENLWETGLDEVKRVVFPLKGKARSEQTKIIKNTISGKSLGEIQFDFQKNIGLDTQKAIQDHISGNPIYGDITHVAVKTVEGSRRLFVFGGKKGKGSFELSGISNKAPPKRYLPKIDKEFRSLSFEKPPSHRNIYIVAAIVLAVAFIGLAPFLFGTFESQPIPKEPEKEMAPREVPKVVPTKLDSVKEHEIKEIVARLRKAAEGISNEEYRHDADLFIEAFIKHPRIDKTVRIATLDHPYAGLIPTEEDGEQIRIAFISKEFALTYPEAFVRSVLVHEGTHARRKDLFDEHMKRMRGFMGLMRESRDTQTAELFNDSRFIRRMCRVFIPVLENERLAYRAGDTIILNEIRNAGSNEEFLKTLTKDFGGDDLEGQRQNGIIIRLLKDLTQRVGRDGQPDDYKIKLYALRSLFKEAFIGTREGQFQRKFNNLVLSIVMLKTTGIVDGWLEKGVPKFRIKNYPALLEWIETNAQSLGSVTPGIEAGVSEEQVAALNNVFNTALHEISEIPGASALDKARGYQGSSLGEETETPLTILVLDDEENIRELMSMAIVRAVENVNLVLAESGDDAIEKLREMKSAPHLVFLDMRFPGEATSLDTAQVIRSMPGGEGARIIVASGTPDDVTPDLRAITQAVLVKPFQLKAIIEIAKSTNEQLKADIEGQSLGTEVPTLKELQQQIPEHKLTLEALSDDSQIGPHPLVYAWNYNVRKNPEIFINLLKLIESKSKFFFESFMPLIGTETAGEVIKEDLLWFLFVVQAASEHPEVFEHLAKEDFIGKEGLREALKSKDFSGAIDDVTTAKPFEEGHLLKAFAHDVEDFRNAVTLAGNIDDLTLELEYLSSENLSVFFKDSARSVKLLESSRELQSYLEDKNLITGVFQGGGIKGVVYGGVLEELEKENIWFNRVAGTSAGAIVAVLIAVGYTPTEIKEILLTTDFNKFKDWRWGIVPPVINMFFTGALYRGKAFERWLEKLIEAKIGYVPTFKELSIDLTVVGSDLSDKKKMRPLFFNKENTPELKVSKAVRMSMSIPYFYEMVKWKGPYRNKSKTYKVVDGGAGSNFPLVAFIDEVTEGEPIWGFSLVSEDVKEGLWARAKMLLLEALTFHPLIWTGQRLMKFLLENRDRLLAERNDWARVLEIPVDVGTTDFNLSEQKKLELIENGRKATRDKIDLVNRGHDTRYSSGLWPKMSTEDLQTEDLMHMRDLARQALYRRDFKVGEQIQINDTTYEIEEVLDDAGLMHKGVILLNQPLTYFAIARDIQTDKRYMLNKVRRKGQVKELQAIQAFPLKRIANIEFIGEDAEGRELLVSEFFSRSLRRHLKENEPADDPKFILWTLRNGIVIGEDLLLLQEEGRQFGGINYNDVYLNDENEWILVQYGKEAKFSDVEGLASVIYSGLTGKLLEREFDSWVLADESGELIALDLDTTGLAPHSLNKNVPQKLSRLVWRGLLGQISLENFVREIRSYYVSAMTLDEVMDELRSIRRYTVGANNTIDLIAKRLSKQTYRIPKDKLIEIFDTLIEVLNQAKDKTMEVYPKAGAKEIESYQRVMTRLMEAMYQVSKYLDKDEVRKMKSVIFKVLLSLDKQSRESSGVMRAVEDNIGRLIAVSDPDDQEELKNLEDRILGILRRGTLFVGREAAAERLINVLTDTLLKRHNISEETKGETLRALNKLLKIRSKDGTGKFVFLERAKYDAIKMVLNGSVQDSIPYDLNYMANSYIAGRSLGETLEEDDDRILKQRAGELAFTINNVIKRLDQIDIYDMESGKLNIPIGPISDEDRDKIDVLIMENQRMLALIEQWQDAARRDPPDPNIKLLVSLFHLGGFWSYYDVINPLSSLKTSLSQAHENDVFRPQFKFAIEDGLTRIMDQGELFNAYSNSEVPTRTYMVIRKHTEKRVPVVRDWTAWPPETDVEKMAYEAELEGLSETSGESLGEAEKDFVIKIDKRSYIKNIKIEQKEYPVKKSPSAIFPIVEVFINGKKYRIGKDHYLVIELADGKKIYWGGQHNLAYSFFFEHYKDEAEDILKKGGIVWFHTDNHPDIGHYAGRPKKPWTSLDWKAEIPRGYSQLGYGNYMGFMWTTGLLSEMHYIRETDELKKITASTKSPFVLDLDIDVMVDNTTGKAKDEILEAFKPSLLEAASKSQVIFITNSSELSVEPRGVPLHINPHDAMRFNIEVIRGIAQQAAKGASLGRKDRVKYNAEQTTEYIIQAFQEDVNRKKLPTATELSSVLGPTSVTFMNHHAKTIYALELRIDQDEFDPELRTRIQRAILVRENLALAAALSIIGLFERDKDRINLPTAKNLAGELGVSSQSLYDRYPEIVKVLRVTVDEEDLGAELKERLLAAPAIRKRTSRGLIPETDISGASLGEEIEMGKLTDPSVLQPGDLVWFERRIKPDPEPRDILSGWRVVSENIKGTIKLTESSTRFTQSYPQHWAVDSKESIRDEFWVTPDTNYELTDVKVRTISKEAADVKWMQESFKAKSLGKKAESLEPRAERQLVKNTLTRLAPVKVIMSHDNYMRLSDKQREEFIGIGSINSKTFKGIVYDAPEWDKPLPNIEFITGSALEANNTYPEITNTIHLSKGETTALEDLSPVKDKISFFKYQTEENGLLGVALLLSQAIDKEAFIAKYGLEQRNGFFVEVSEFLNSIVQEFEATLAVAVAA